MVNSERYTNMSNSQSDSASENKLVIYCKSDVVSLSFYICRSVSPNTSPRSSPRPSPRPQTKREHSRSDTHLTVNYKEQISGNFHKNDSSPVSNLVFASTP